MKMVNEKKHYYYKSESKWGLNKGKSNIFKANFASTFAFQI